MKKYLNYALAAALVGSLSLSVTSCKSDKDVVSEDVPSKLGIDNDIVSHGIVTDMCDAVIEVPVDCDGRWYAILGAGQKESPDWVTGPPTMRESRPCAWLSRRTAPVWTARPR